MVKRSETMGDKLRAMAAAVDAMDAEMTKLEQLSAYYSMMVVSLQKVTTALASAYEGTDAGETYAGAEIREAAVILQHAAPPLKAWADNMLEAWQKPKSKRGAK